MNIPTLEAQAAAVLRRARIGIAFAAMCDNNENMRHWQGHASAAQLLASGQAVRMAERDAQLANEQLTLLEAAGAALPVSIKDLTLAEVQQILAAQGFQCPTDTVADRNLGAGEVLEHSMVPAIDGHDEHAAPRVDVGNGSGAHGNTSQVETTIVAQQGGAA